MYCAARDRKRRLNSAPSRPSHLQSKFRCQGSEQRPSMRIWSRAHETHITLELTSCARHGNFTFRIHRLRKEAHHGYAKCAVAITLRGIRDVQCSAEACEIEHAILRCDIDMPQRGRAAAEEAAEARWSQAPCLAGTEDEIGFESRNAPLDQWRSEPLEALVPVQNVEHACLEAQPPRGTGIRFLVTVPAPGTEDGKAAEWNREIGRHGCKLPFHLPP